MLLCSVVAASVFLSGQQLAVLPSTAAAAFLLLTRGALRVGFEGIAGFSHRFVFWLQNARPGSRAWRRSLLKPGTLFTWCFFDLAHERDGINFEWNYLLRRYLHLNLWVVITPPAQEQTAPIPRNVQCVDDPAAHGEPGDTRLPAVLR